HPAPVFFNRAAWQAIPPQTNTGFAEKDDLRLFKLTPNDLLHGDRGLREVTAADLQNNFQKNQEHQRAMIAEWLRFRHENRPEIRPASNAELVLESIRQSEVNRLDAAIQTGHETAKTLVDAAKTLV